MVLDLNFGVNCFLCHNFHFFISSYVKYATHDTSQPCTPVSLFSHLCHDIRSNFFAISFFFSSFLFLFYFFICLELYYQPHFACHRATIGATVIGVIWRWFETIHCLARECGLHETVCTHATDAFTWRSCAACQSTDSVYFSLIFKCAAPCRWESI